MDPSAKITAVQQLLGSDNVLWVALKRPDANMYEIYCNSQPQDKPHKNKDYYLAISGLPIKSHIPAVTPAPGDYIPPKKSKSSLTTTDYPDDPEEYWPDDIATYDTYMRMYARSQHSISVIQ